jgi:propionate CoA-transferase
VEIAPGVDLERDILGRMDFRPIIEVEPRIMDARLFGAGPMRLKEDLLNLRLADRLTFDSAEDIFFVNFEGLAVNNQEMVEDIRVAVEAILEPVGHEVYAIVNYDNFSILPELLDGYTDMVKYLVDRYYTGVARYTTSAFLRMKLGDALKKRDVAPHIYESSSEARRALKTE